MKKQSTKFWYYGNAELGTLQHFMDKLIEQVYTIISIIPIEFDFVCISKTHTQIVKTILLLEKEIKTK